MGSKRKIINVDEEKCTGCGQCIPNCPEGALQVIDGKARLVSDLFCDGLGACVGHCPEGAMTVEERAAEPYDEAKVMANIVKAGPNTIAAHLRHLKDHSAMEYYVQALDFLRARGVPPPEKANAKSQESKLACGCPGSAVRELHPQSAISNLQSEMPRGCPGSAVRELTPSDTRSLDPSIPSRPSALRNWPIQLTLMPVTAPYLKGADLLISADCVGSSHPNFHEDLVKGRVLIIACPKLDDADAYIEKLTRMFAESTPKSVTCAHMTVPCCSGLVRIVKQAIADSDKTMPFAEVTIDVDGKKVA
ncbi:MAG: 4Fe-4S binding protein [candidate division WOR-3 bacterium]|nr:4Fe-4S binding protein [candidate division WOR-3 bacterium]